MKITRLLLLSGALCTVAAFAAHAGIPADAVQKVNEIAEAAQTGGLHGAANTSIVAGLVAVIYSMARIGEFLIAKRMKKDEPAEVRLSAEDLAKLESILQTVRENYDIKTKVLERVNEVKTAINLHQGNCSACAARVEKILADTDKMLDMHDRTDEYGVPVWYVPRSWVENQREQANALARIADTQRDTLVVLERLSDRIDDLSDKH